MCAKQGTKQESNLQTKEMLDCYENCDITILTNKVLAEIIH